MDSSKALTSMGYRKAGQREEAWLKPIGFCILSFIRDRYLGLYFPGENGRLLCWESIEVELSGEQEKDSESIAISESNLLQGFSFPVRGTPYGFLTVEESIEFGMEGE